MTLVGRYLPHKTKSEFYFTVFALEMSQVVHDLESLRPPLTATPELLDRLLQCIEVEIVPLTKEGVSKGNKVFGAAILDADLKTVMAQTNSEITCPLFHGEVHCIYQWSQKTHPRERGKAAQESTFLSTHEPCCMCISSIVWAGFTRCYYLFSYEHTSAQGIPHDINIMHELWNVPTYRKQSKFCSTACIMDLVDQLEDTEKRAALKARVDHLIKVYDEMSKQYHSEKTSNADNSLAFD
jgi:tRNA(Arg) A34 adenosine deaminase TadA